ncbi:MAG: hypothetical protein H8E55_27325 [Pelagibacterales bacterium]|nr:hypothetical protein [Pelagibacterales bacterium]
MLNLLNFSINLEAKNPKIFVENKEIRLEKISTSYNIGSFFKKEFGINNIDFETQNNEIKQVLKLLRLNKDYPQLFILDKVIEQGEIKIDAKISFDQKGNILDNYKLSGIVNNLSLKLLNKKEIKNLNLNFNYFDKNLNLNNLSLDYLGIKILSEKLSIKKQDEIYIIEGDFKNPKVIIPKNITSFILKNDNFDNVILSSENNFSLKLNKKYKVSDLKIKSRISLEEANFNFKNNLIKNYIPNFKDKFKLTNHILDIQYKNKLSLKGNGKLEIANQKDEIKYNLDFIEDKFNYDFNLSLNEIPIKLDLINFLKKENVKSQLKIKGKTNKNRIKIERISLETNGSLISADDFELTNRYRIVNFKKVKLDYIDKNKIRNDLIISKSNKVYIVKGKNFGLSKIVDKILIGNNEDSLKLFDKKNKIFKIDFDKNYIDKDHYLVGLKGKFQIKNNDLYDLDLSSKFFNNKSILLLIKSSNNNKVTTFYSDFAKPFVKKYKFIKGFEDGKLDFSSVKKNKITNSKLKIYDFKLKELPILTRILTLASLQGIADILSGEGVGFDEFEMSFQNKENLMEIKELYAIGPAISILMDGYVQRGDLVSLRGTLVPATTINKFVGSIPILGSILVGKKTGEGVFGVSFKIKGPPQNLKTTVNPIKTLTPRFITRTLEKIKKSN